MCSWKMKWQGGRDVARSGRETKWGSSWRSPKWALNVAYRLTGQSFKEWTNRAQNGGISCFLGTSLERGLPITSLVASIGQESIEYEHKLGNWSHVQYRGGGERECKRAIPSPFSFLCVWPLFIVLFTQSISHTRPGEGVQKTDSGSTTWVNFYIFYCSLQSFYLLFELVLKVAEESFT